MLKYRNLHITHTVISLADPHRLHQCGGNMQMMFECQHTALARHNRTVALHLLKWHKVPNILMSVGPKCMHRSVKSLMPLNIVKCHVHDLTCRLN
jgi:hypothetical protein